MVTMRDSPTAVWDVNKQPQQHPEPNVFMVGHIVAGNGFCTHVQYKIRVILGDEEWIVFHRYRQFAELYETLLQAFPDEMGSLKMAFPPKHLFSSTAHSVVLLRTRLLGEFLHRVISEPRLLQSPQLQQFLEMNSRGLSPYASRHGQNTVLMEAPLFVRSSQDQLFLWMRRYVVLTATGELKVFESRTSSGSEPLLEMRFREVSRHKSMVWIEHRNEVASADSDKIPPTPDRTNNEYTDAPIVCLSTGDLVVHLRSQVRPKGPLDWEIRKWAAVMKQFPCEMWIEPLSPTTSWRQEQQIDKMLACPDQDAFFDEDL